MDWIGKFWFAGEEGWDGNVGMGGSFMVLKEWLIVEEAIYVFGGIVSLRFDYCIQFNELCGKCQ